MSNTIIEGKVSFVNHEKKYVMIEYAVGGKKKAINGNVDDKTQQQWKEKGVIKKQHLFHIGDVVDFIAKLSDRGDKMIAVDIRFKYNTALDMLLNRSKIVNKFIGYLKQADDKYFVKEVESYFLFEVPLSPWQLPFDAHDLNESVNFSLENIEKKERATAKLFNNKYIPEFYTAVKHQKSKKPVAATVYNVSAHGIYLNVIGEKVQAKIPLVADKEYKIGDTLDVIITHIGDKRIIVEPVATTA